MTFDKADDLKTGRIEERAIVKADELIQIVVAIKLAQSSVQQIVLEESITRTVVTVLIPVHDCARTGDAPPDLIDHTSKPVQAGVLVARVGICGRVRGGLNVGKRCDRRRLFERLVVANRIIRIARMLRVCDQSFLIQSILGDKSLFGAFRSICSIQIANFLDCFLPKIQLIKPS